MSIETWREEFFPVPANSPEAQASELAAIDHCIRKWEGFRRESLVRHELTGTRTGGASACALCWRYDIQYDSCDGCPLEAARGGVPCTESRDDEKIDPYEKFTGTGDPEPMLYWLRRARDLVQIDPRWRNGS